MVAYDWSNVDIFKLLIDAGADVTKSGEVCTHCIGLYVRFELKTSQSGRVALLAACNKKDVEVVKVLIKAEADVNYNKYHYVN